MVASPYRPVSWNSEPVTQQRLQQMANNMQWLYENNAKVRYSATSITRDNGVKVLVGKTAVPASATDYSDAVVYFGSYFTAGCQPIVTSVYADTAYGLRKFIVNRGLGGPIDHRGFIGHVSSHEPQGIANDIRGGWMHWMAVGY